MTTTYDDGTTEAMLDAALELATQTPAVLTQGINEIQNNLILLYEDAEACHDKPAMMRLNATWEALEVIRNAITNQTISVASVAIVIRTLKIQRNEYRQIASEAIERVKQLSRLTGGE